MGRQLKPGQKVLLINYIPHRQGEIIRQCEHDERFWIVNVAGHGPMRVRNRAMRVVKEVEGGAGRD